MNRVSVGPTLFSAAEILSERGGRRAPRAAMVDVSSKTELDCFLSWLVSPTLHGRRRLLPPSPDTSERFGHEA